MREIVLTKGQICLVDDEDGYLGEYRWYPQKGRYTEYAYRTDYTCEPVKRIAMHRVILSSVLGVELTRNDFVDHVDGNGLNNLRDNLRLASQTQNARNGIRRKANKTGYKGVWPINNGFAAKICVNRENIYLGFYKTPEEAHEAYKEAAIKYHGEFARFE